MKRRKSFISLLIFIILLAILEIVLRLNGSIAGTTSNEIYPKKVRIPQILFQADSFGISTYAQNSPRVPSTYVINQQGFRNDFDFDARTVDSVRNQSSGSLIFMIGDSYTEGCCDQPIDSSFSDLLQENLAQTALNFGIGGSDLVHYRQIAKKYVPMLKPDLLIVFFYLGNDIAYFEREISPGIPSYFAIKDYPWLSSKIPPFLKDQSNKNELESAEEAYHFQLNHYTLLGENVNLLEKVIRRSVVLSQLYLNFRLWYPRIKWGLKNRNKLDRFAISNSILMDINAICRNNQTEMLILGIPSPKDMSSQSNLEEEYGSLFNDLNYKLPAIEQFESSDYDGIENKNHFTNSGHLKFYRFSIREIQANLE